MTISYKWLLQYLPEPVPIAALSHILTSIGLEVEAVETSEAVKGSLEGLVIGAVLTCEKHPNADKLSVTTVDTGNAAPLRIVCGAPNVAPGQRVVVAPPGTTVHPRNGASFLIKKAKIRGVESEGMICAEDEIGLGDSHAGILVLPEDAPVGVPAKDYFNIPEADYAIHIGLTPNRSDAMSHIGVARDVCAYLAHHEGKSYAVRHPDVALAEPEFPNPVRVVVEAAEACSRYAGVYIGNVRVGASPGWLKQRLETIGVRSINNIVDITNYVLHEYGQPLHAFDADRIRGNTVTVRFGKEGEPFTTLDGRERTLRSSDLMICDEAGGMCLAGVFGGIGSGVTETTKSIFLESAYFSPAFIRRTSLHHGLRTDAATHFEKGVDMTAVIPALRRAASLIAEIAGCDAVSEITDHYPVRQEAVTIAVRYDYINRLCGKTFEPGSIRGILEALQFGLSHEDENGFTAVVPANKTDVLQPADIAEEILRMDGLDNIPIPGRMSISLSRPFTSDRPLKEKIAHRLCGMGLREIITNSITSSKYYPGQEGMVTMLNSLSSELDVMRPSMLESGLEVIQYNVNRKNQDLALFEFGKTYGREQGRYAERPVLALWLTGNVHGAQWNQKEQKADIFYLKGIIHNLLDASGIRAVVNHEEQYSYTWKGQTLCTVEAAAGDRLDLFGLKQPVYFACINWDIWHQAFLAHKVQYRETPRFPAVQRDLAIVLDKKISYLEVQKVTERLKLEAMKSFGLFDIFESDKLGADKKSFALSYTFQLQDRTLTDQETDELMRQLMDAYKTKLQAQIRE